jgi:hypothetical protein
MRVERSRIHLLTGGVALAVTLASRRRTRAAPAGLPDVTVYKTPT